MDLSVIIPARNEMFLSRTIDSILEKMRGDTEVIAVCDGAWPDPPVKDHPKVRLIYHPESIGQRAATNEAARLSKAKYIMKLDAHCDLDKGFDVKLMADCEPDWTVVPRMYNLHAFDWKCTLCGKRTYQGPKPEKCKSPCNNISFEMEMVWQRRKGHRSDYMWFDKDLRFSYFDKNFLKKYGDDIKALKEKYSHSKRPWAKGDITDQMCAVGACWFMHRERFWELDGLDEDHGSWGQMGVEIAMKSWLSGGRQVVNKKTWFAHMFRTQGGDFGFPYKLKGSDVKKAREYSRQLWKGNGWPKAKHKLSWMIDRFSPLPDWDEDIKTVSAEKGLVYYTDNRCEERITRVCREQLKRTGLPIVSVSQHPIDFENNIVMDLDRSILSQTRQILKGLMNIKTDIVFLVEHDILYHPSHFNFVPPETDVFYYNQNRWPVCAKTGQALFYYTKALSHCCAYRDLMIEHYKKRVNVIEREGYRASMGHSPGSRGDAGFGAYKTGVWFSKYPNIDIRHNNNFTKNRFRIEQFRRKPKGWKLADAVPWWGKTKDRFDDFLNKINKEKVVIEMADSFDGVEAIILQPGSATVPYTFTFAASSSSTANDGSIPYGTTISGADVKAFDEGGTDRTAEIVASETNTTLVVTVNLKYPATTGEGRYSLEFVITLDSGAVLEFDFTRIYAKDIAA